MIFSGLFVSFNKHPKPNRSTPPVYKGEQQNQRGDSDRKEHSDVRIKPEFNPTDGVENSERYQNGNPKGD